MNVSLNFLSDFDQANLSEQIFFSLDLSLYIQIEHTEFEQFEFGFWIFGSWIFCWNMWTISVFNIWPLFDNLKNRRILTALIHKIL